MKKGQSCHQPQLLCDKPINLSSLQQQEIIMKTTINPIVRVKAAHIGAAVVCALSFGASASPSPVINSVDIASLVTQQSNDVNAMLSLSGNQSVHAVNTVDIDKTGVS
ncbi:MAG: hypothetical protein ACI8WB_004920, partial [Phenylobacterium sp.]